MTPIVLTTTLAPLFGTDGVDITGVMDEVVGLLPVVLPVLIGFIAIRKGISFVLGMLHSA